MDRLRSCVCDRPIHTYTLVPGVKDRIRSRSCCRCDPDCLCHGGEGSRKMETFGILEALAKLEARIVKLEAFMRARRKPPYELR